MTSARGPERVPLQKGFKVWGLGFIGFRVDFWLLGFRGLAVWTLGFQFEGLGLRGAGGVAMPFGLVC